MKLLRQNSLTSLLQPTAMIYLFFILEGNPVVLNYPTARQLMFYSSSSSVSFSLSVIQRVSTLFWKNQLTSRYPPIPLFSSLLQLLVNFSATVLG